MWPFANLKGFASSRPPLVIFMLCLCAFGVVLLSLAYVIESNDTKDPDLANDWNVFLNSFSQLGFCMADSPLYAGTKPWHSIEEGQLKVSEDMDIKNNDYNMYLTKNYSVSFPMTVHPTPEFLNITHDSTQLFGRIMGHQLGLTGPASKSALNVTFVIPNNWNGSKCKEDGSCTPFETKACVTFEAEQRLFPQTRTPENCKLSLSTVNFHQGFLRAYQDYTFIKYYSCYQQTKIVVHYDTNPTLTVMLSHHDRSIVTLHLMHTSCFLFVMVVTMLFYAMIRGSPHDVKYRVIQKNDDV